jgi:hypothetical protein
MRALLVGCLCVGAILSATITAQNGDDFSLGDVRLQLGAPEAAVRRQLDENHTITPGGFVITKNGPPYSQVGSVTFKDGKLSWATKDWDEGLDQSASVEVVRRMIGIIGGRRGCATATVSTEAPTLRRSALVIQCSPVRQVEVSVSEAPGSGKPFVSVQEYYGPVVR